MPDDLLQGIETDEETPAEAAAPPEEPAADPASGGAEAGAEGETGSEGEPQAEDAELVITLGDEQPEAEAANDTPPIRQMRQVLREKDRELRRLAQENAQLKAGGKPAEAADDPGERPKLADFDFDEEKHAEALEGWVAKKAQADARKRQQQEAQEQQQKAWAERVQTYQTSAKALKVPDFEDAEATVIGTLNTVQQSLLLKAKKPEILVYALGKSPKRLQELAKIADPVDFVFAVADLQREIKVQPKKQPPAPEGRVRTDVAGKAAVDSAMDRLIAEAMKTGDMSKVRQYQREKKQRQAA